MAAQSVSSPEVVLARKEATMTAAVTTKGAATAVKCVTTRADGAEADAAAAA